MCGKSHLQNCCIYIGGLAIIFSLVEFGYRTYQLATRGINKLVLGIVICWLLIFLAAIVLIVGAVKKKTLLLMIWVIVSLVCGMIIIILKIIIYSLYFSNNPYVTYPIVGVCLIILLILMVFLFVYYPYAYRHELREGLYR
ncbi:uncharacterized protein LOC108109023 [Drosophila eugracilis]|uniref:uncharacterized protein LOC108109023 n=1 Tax=Drosophila eugracilis TaxID=29029 RepID=UPI0007E80DE4|nr:uncharacterized protein LOC108109023 [Drosophila eugracilis]